MAMAESKSTVLVTGAGGRTGEAFLVFALMGSWKRVAVMRDSRDVPISVMSFSGSRLE